MTVWPRISIVTPSYNQGRFIAETIESVLRQDYPDVEHIVVDGMSTDETPEVLARYPHLRVIREPDRGQADAINKGFAVATGSIYSFLNSDDVLLPGALERVAAEIRPEEGRHVVMGRCRFIDETGRYTGIEHPSQFESFRRVLEVWKGHTIPQPAVFWTAQVWWECGPACESLVLDYDLFCRMARKYKFHAIDQVLAAYRLHENSKTCRSCDFERLEECIRVSRQYWGSPVGLLYWGLWWSLLCYRLNRRGRAHRWIAAGVSRWERGNKFAGAMRCLPGLLAAPDVAANMIVLPAARILLRKLGRFGWVQIRQRGIEPQTRAFLERTKPWDDGWVGPCFEAERRARGGERSVLVQGAAHLKYMEAPLVLRVFLDGEPVGEIALATNGHFCRSFKLGTELSGGEHLVRIEASTWWVPHKFEGSGDYRPLSWLTLGEDSVQLLP